MPTLSKSLRRDACHFLTEISNSNFNGNLDFEFLTKAQNFNPFI
jgi:hypothetical protein